MVKKVRWLVRIPLEAKVKVEKGDEVDKGDVLAEVGEVKEIIVDFSKEIQILGPKDRDKFLVEVTGKENREGEIIFVKKGWSSKKIAAPISGKIVKLDEFNNLYVRVEEKKAARAVFSPVKAKVTKNDQEGIELEFGVEEYQGRGLTENKAWGMNGLGRSEKISDLNFNDEGKVILSEKIDQALVNKAEVMGVSGLIIISDGIEGRNIKIESKLPVLAVEKEDWDKIQSEVDKKKEILVDAENGRLWLTV